MSDRKRAEKFVRDCLEIMDGSAAAGIKRVGTAEFERTVLKVMKLQQKTKKAAKK